MHSPAQNALPPEPSQTGHACLRELAGSNKQKTTRLLLVDDHILMRKGLRLLVGEEGMEVVGEADDGREGVELARKLKPDLVVMDLSMKNLNGVDATRQIIQQCPGVRVLTLSASNDRRHVVSSLQAGSGGYVLKESAVDELVAAIREVIAGRVYLSPRLADTVIRECVVGGAQQGNNLTAREREILQLLAEGKAMKEIALMLGISTKTVESHRRAMMEKLQMFSMAELTKHAVREGLTTID